MVKRYMIVPDSAVSLETMAFLEMTAVSGEEAKKHARKDETVIEISAYPGADPRLREQPHLIIFRPRRTNQGPRIEVDSLQPTYEAAITLCKAHELEKCEALVCSADYIRNLKTQEMLYSSHATVLSVFKEPKQNSQGR